LADFSVLPAMKKPYGGCERGRRRARRVGGPRAPPADGWAFDCGDYDCDDYDNGSYGSNCSCS
jgi:hypothetical protein